MYKKDILCKHKHPPGNELRYSPLKRHKIVDDFLNCWTRDPVGVSFLEGMQHLHQQDTLEDVRTKLAELENEVGKEFGGISGW